MKHTYRISELVTLTVQNDGLTLLVETDSNKPVGFTSEKSNNPFSKIFVARFLLDVIQQLARELNNIKWASRR